MPAGAAASTCQAAAAQAGADVAQLSVSPAAEGLGVGSSEVVALVAALVVALVVALAKPPKSSSATVLAEQEGRGLRGLVPTTGVAQLLAMLPGDSAAAAAAGACGLSCCLSSSCISLVSGPGAACAAAGGASTVLLGLV